MSRTDAHRRKAQPRRLPDETFRPPAFTATVRRSLSRPGESGTSLHGIFSLGPLEAYLMHFIGKHHTNGFAKMSCAHQDRLPVGAPPVSQFAPPSCGQVDQDTSVLGSPEKGQADHVRQHFGSLGLRRHPAAEGLPACDEAEPLGPRGPPRLPPRAPWHARPPACRAAWTPYPRRGTGSSASRPAARQGRARRQP
jgi:hypothetical protein